MTMVLRRTAIWLVVLAVALASAYVGFQLAQGQSPAQIGHNVGVELLGNKGNGKTPPPCGSYTKPPKNPNVHEHNKNCDDRD